MVVESCMYLVQFCSHLALSGEKSFRSQVISLGISGVAPKTLSSTFTCLSVPYAAVMRRKIRGGFIVDDLSFTWNHDMLPSFSVRSADAELTRLKVGCRSP